jgi:hypothetical protein
MSNALTGSRTWIEQPSPPTLTVACQFATQGYRLATQLTIQNFVYNSPLPYLQEVAVPNSLKWPVI